MLEGVFIEEEGAEDVAAAAATSMAGGGAGVESFSGMAVVEATLMELPAKMRWLNATFRSTVSGQVTDTCRAIADKYSATAITAASTGRAGGQGRHRGAL